MRHGGRETCEDPSNFIHRHFDELNKYIKNGKKQVNIGKVQFNFFFLKHVDFLKTNLRIASNTPTLVSMNPIQTQGRTHKD